MVAMKVAAGVVVLAAGGTAFAAGTGALPTAAQERAHRMFSPLGIPAPRPGPSPLRSGDGAGPSGVPATIAPTAVTPSATTAPGTTTALADGTPLGLCRAWDAARDKKHGKAMTSASRRALAAAAGGAAKVDDYCTALLAGAPAAEAPNGGPSAPPGPAPATPSHPGKGGGKDKDKDKSHPAPSPPN
jgi:hypothetical protein